MTQTEPQRPAHVDATHAGAVPADRATVVARQKEAFGGVKLGSAFFGWLTAMGMVVVLTALVAAAGAGVGIVSSAQEVVDATGADANEIGWAGAIAVLVVVFLAYYSGGYVAGRMARFNGAKQGLAVFGWAVVVAIVIAILSAVAGAQYDVLDQLNNFPRIPSDLSGLTLQAGVTLVGVVAAALVGAVVGGLAGMNFHRRVDKAGLGR